MQPSNEDSKVAMQLANLASQLGSMAFSEDVFAQLFSAYGAKCGYGFTTLERMSVDNKQLIFLDLVRYVQDQMDQANKATKT